MSLADLRAWADALIAGRSWAHPLHTLRGAERVFDALPARLPGTALFLGSVSTTSRLRRLSQGTYNITGTLADGQLVVNATAGGLVELTLDGIDISNSTNAPICVMNAGSVEIVLADQSENYVYDPAIYVYEDPEADEPNAALFSKDTMLISGTGSLTVYGSYNDAIAGEDELIITGGTINAVAADDGIRGKDYLLIQDGDITITSGGDGLKSDNDTDAALGYIAVGDAGLVTQWPGCVAGRDNRLDDLLFRVDRRQRRVGTAAC